MALRIGGEQGRDTVKIPRELKRLRAFLLPYHQGPGNSYLTKVGNENGLMDKLVKWKINEVTLINADQKKIDKMSFLNSKEKEKLINKLKEYSLKKEICTV